MPRIAPAKPQSRTKRRKRSRSGSGALLKATEARWTPRQVAERLQGLTGAYSGAVTVDTETSGLHTDDGARAAVLSMAWADPERQWEAIAQRGGVSWAEEEIAPGHVVPIASIAWPFDQGVDAWALTYPKDEYNGQGTLDLFPGGENLPAEEWNAALQMLADHPEGLVMHPGKFDSGIIRAGLRYAPDSTGGVDLMPKVVWDTLNVSELLWPLEQKGLKPTHDRLFPGTKYGDAAKLVKDYLRKNRLPKGRWDLVPWEIIGAYADMDARMTKKIELRQIWEIEYQQAGSWLYSEDDADHPVPEDAVYRHIERRLRVSNWLYRMEQRGLPYDPVTSRLAGETARKVALRVAERLPFRVNEARAFFFEQDYVSKKGVEGLGLIPYEMTAPTARHPKGQPKITDAIVRRMQDDDVPHVEQYALYQQIENAISMWYFGYADKVGGDNRLRTNYKQYGTRSSRFSVERVNLQAIPQDYRLVKMFEAAKVPGPREIIAKAVREQYPGWRLWEADMQQAELRIGALHARCRPMLRMLKAGDDLHSHTAKTLFQIDESSKEFKFYRQVGKQANFTLGFGAGLRTFLALIYKQTGVDLGEGEGRRLFRGWHDLYPEWSFAVKREERRMDKLMEQHGHGWVTFMNGERRWFQPYEESYKSFNQRVQGDQAQFVLDWALASERYLVRKGFNMDPEIGGCGIVLTVHDSLGLLLPDTDEGEGHVKHIAAMAKRMWRKRFKGVDGGADYKSWD